MEINKRTQDLETVFNHRWTANQNKANAGVQARRNHFNRMFNIQDKTAQRRDLLYQNSVEGRVKALNERMAAMNSADKINRMNNFRNGFK